MTTETYSYAISAITSNPVVNIHWSNARGYFALCTGCDWRGPNRSIAWAPAVSDAHEHAPQCPTP